MQFKTSFVKANRRLCLSRGLLIVSSAHRQRAPAFPAARSFSLVRR